MTPHKRIYGFSPPETINPETIDLRSDDGGGPEAFAYEWMLRLVIGGLDSRTRQQAKRLFEKLVQTLEAGRTHAETAPRATSEVVAEWTTMIETVEEFLAEMSGTEK
ncbi:MAG: hypothetical protein F4020_04940 [Gammaproteobacteria bacterium]|nr:hypothetical protein [Gammaproteobacteria bacterium]